MGCSGVCKTETGSSEICAKLAKKVWWRAGPLQYKQTEFGWLWSNSDFELSKKINAQNWTYHCSLQKTSGKKFALKQDSF
jgi:hypothetical protein